MVIREKTCAVVYWSKEEAGLGTILEVCCQLISFVITLTQRENRFCHISSLLFPAKHVAFPSSKSLSFCYSVFMRAFPGHFSPQDRIPTIQLVASIRPLYRFSRQH